MKLCLQRNQSSVFLFVISGHFVSEPWLVPWPKCEQQQQRKETNNDDALCLRIGYEVSWERITIRTRWLDVELILDDCCPFCCCCWCRGCCSKDTPAWRFFPSLYCRSRQYQSYLGPIGPKTISRFKKLIRLFYWLFCNVHISSCSRPIKTRLTKLESRKHYLFNAILIKSNKLVEEKLRCTKVRPEKDQSRTNSDQRTLHRV